MKSSITVITGTSRGIGKALAKYYIEKGHLVIGCSRKQSEETLERYEHYSLSVDDETAVRKMFSDIRKKHGKVDNLINNAGIASMNHCMLTPISTVTSIFNTNVLGTFIFCCEAAKLMQKQKYGRIVNFSTVALPLKLEGEAIYASSKAAVVSLTQILSKELAAYGITINTIGPTPIITDLIKSIPEHKIQHLINQQAIKRFGEFSDVANVIDFFLQPQSDFITGQTIYLGGV